MPKFLRQISSLILLLGALAVSAQAQSPQYTVVDLGLFSPRAINDSDQVIGSAEINNRQEAVLFADGVFTILRPPGASSAEAYGINNRGEVVGFSLFCDLINNQCQNSRTRAFVYSKSGYTILGTLGGRDSLAFAINDFGQVTGYSDTAQSQRHAFIYKDGTFTDIGASSGAETMPASINASGQVVGFASSNTSNRGAFLHNNGSFLFFEVRGFASDINNHADVVGGISGNDDGTGRAFFFSGGVEQDLGTLNGSIYALAKGINNLGQVVGESGIGPIFSTNQKAFVYSGGVMQDLNTLVTDVPGRVLRSAVDINDAGQILVEGTVNGSDQHHGFLLTPTKPMLLTQPSTNKAIAVQSVMFLRDPFTTTTNRNLSTDTRTRVTLLVRNMETLTGETLPPPTVQAEDAQGGVFSLPVEFVSKVPNAGWLTQITVSLPDSIAGRDVQLTIGFRGQASNKAVVTVAASPPN
jgi:probable HAF family extracellular repeat protein